MWMQDLHYMPWKLFFSPQENARTWSPVRNALKEHNPWISLTVCGCSVENPRRSKVREGDLQFACHAKHLRFMQKEHIFICSMGSFFSSQIHSLGPWKMSKGVLWHFQRLTKFIPVNFCESRVRWVFLEKSQCKTSMFHWDVLPGIG